MSETNMEEEKPKLESCTFTFTQQANCLNSRDEIEQIEITFTSDLGLDFTGDGFFVVKTDGWSVDSEEEFKELFARIKKVL